MMQPFLIEDTACRWLSKIQRVAQTEGDSQVKHSWLHTFPVGAGGDSRVSERPNSIRMDTQVQPYVFIEVVAARDRRACAGLRARDVYCLSMSSHPDVARYRSTQ
jgi:hypothetical protein